jgi:hypothetical protein
MFDGIDSNAEAQRLSQMYIFFVQVGERGK